MRITILVNDVTTEHPLATTTLLAFSAVRRGHVVHMIGINDLTYFPDGRIGGMARRVPHRTRTRTNMLAQLQSDDADVEAITSDDMDVFWLRYNPSEELEVERWW